MACLQDLSPDELAGLELAMLQAQGDLQGMAADIAKPWPVESREFAEMSRFLSSFVEPYIEQPLAPWQQKMLDWILGDVNREIARQHRADQITVGICILVMLSLAAGAWLWT